MAFDTGKVVTSVGAVPAANSIANSQLTDMAQATFKMRAAGAGTGDPIDGTAAQAKTALAITQGDVASLTTDLAAKAPIDSPTFTTAASGPTPAFGDNDTSLATTAFVQGLVAYGQLTADYTLTSTVATQKLFNFSTNGELTLAQGRYSFKVFLYLTGMSAAAADNMRFRPGAGGTAVVANVVYQTIGQDAANALAVGSLSGTGAVTAAGEANIATGATAAELFVTISGLFNITTAGTIIPSCNLGTAIAAVVKANSCIIVEYLGPNGSNTKGAWS